MSHPTNGRELSSDVASAYADLFAEHVGRPGSVVAVAERAAELIGCVFGVVELPSLVELAGRAEFTTFTCRRPPADSAPGGRRLDAAVAGLRSIGCPGGVMLGGAAQNAAAAALFLGHGFRPTLQEMALGPWPAEDAEPGAAAGTGRL